MMPNSPIIIDLWTDMGCPWCYVGKARLAQAIAEGLPFESARVSANTFDIHRIMHLAKTYGAGLQVFDTLQREYFAGESSPFDNATLLRVCIAEGIPEDEVLAVLHSDQFADTVRLDEQYGHEIGITGVPFTVFDKKYAASGALSADDFANAIATVIGERASI